MKTAPCLFQTIRINALSLMMLTFIFNVVLSSCSSDNDATPDTGLIITERGEETGVPSNEQIGTSGGSLASADGRVTVTIPADALASNTNISIQPISNESPLGLGWGYRLEPEGTTFSKPVTVSFKYDDTLLNGVPAEFLWIVTQASDGSWNALLKSDVNTSTKTVTIETTHFSDWSLARFVDLALQPSSATLRKGKSVTLALKGFSRNPDDDEDELAPLPNLTDLDDEHTPITPLAIEGKRLVSFRAKSWTLNGASAPVSNSNGTLSPNGNVATYKAPDKKPSSNPVAVTLQVESGDQSSQKLNFMVTANITIVEEDLYLLVKVDGQAYEYYQYGYNGAVPPDPNDVALASCAMDVEANVLNVFGMHTVGSNGVSGFSIEIANASEGENELTCMYEEGDDDMNFQLGQGENFFQLNRAIRTMTNNGNCDTEYVCGSANISLYIFRKKRGEVVVGAFSGTLYEERDEFDDDCVSSKAHTIEGEFSLVQIY